MAGSKAQFKTCEKYYTKIFIYGNHLKSKEQKSWKELQGKIEKFSGLCDRTIAGNLQENIQNRLGIKRTWKLNGSWKHYL